MTMVDLGRVHHRQSAAGLWNMSFGFFGIQIGFALQNANASRIFQALGTPLDKLGLMWVAAPLTGLLVQPLVGHFSDRTQGRFGRRRPYFLVGALLAALALFAMPIAPAIWAAAVTLWLLDASLNICMEPFRAFVGDRLAPEQRPAGFAFQTAFIGAGAVVASLAPYVLEHGFGIANVAAPGHIPASVRYGFWFGGAALLGAVLWTVVTTREAPAPPRMAAGENRSLEHGPGHGLRWFLAGVGLALLILVAERRGWLASTNEAYFVAAAVAAFGVAQGVSRLLVRRGRGANPMTQILADLAAMPGTMRQLARVQFLTWGALIIMWVYTTPVVASHVYGTLDPASTAFNQASSWVGVLFAIYSGVAALAAFALPLLARRLGVPRTHMLCLAIGALAFVGLFAIRDATWLVLPMIGVGVAWASILTMPYVLLADALPAEKLGVYMGIFNIFVVVPQLIVATVMGGVLKVWFPGEPAWTMAIAAVVMAAAAIAMVPLARGGRMAGDRAQVDSAIVTS